MLFSYIFFCLFLFSIFLCFTRKDDLRKIRIIALSNTYIIFIATLLLITKFDFNTISFQFVSEIVLSEDKNLKFIIAIDSLSLVFLLLTTFITPLAILGSIYTIKFRLKEFITLIFLVEIFLICFFLTIDLLFFFVFFEVTLIPLFLLIFFYGYRDRRIKAAYYFMLFTVIGSCTMLLAIIYIYNLNGTLDLELLLFSKIFKKTYV